MRIWIGLALLALAACRGADTQAAAAPKPDIFVLTSLPLLFDERFGVGPATGEAALFLREHYTLKPIDLPSQLPARSTLLAAQPRALPAEELVALDNWVRAGGKLVLLADPLLEWPSERPLGDRLRPPASYADTGLLVHWGLRLDAPEERNATRLEGGRLPMIFFSAGKLVGKGTDCQFFRSDIGATCPLGHGRATIVADADWLNHALVTKAGGKFENQMAGLADLLAESGAE